MTEEQWAQKEKRDLFIRVFNTCLMQGKETDEALDISKKAVDKAFENYPSLEANINQVNIELEKATKEETPF